jgi:autoinducer 2-degrading protein
MIIAHVQVQVKTEFVESFIHATLENARNSIHEVGIARFDIIQQKDDPTRFTLVEVYRDADATASHKETPHYKKWRDAVAPMMSVPRTSIKYTNIFPGDEGW